MNKTIETLQNKLDELFHTAEGYADLVNAYPEIRIDAIEQVIQEDNIPIEKGNRDYDDCFTVKFEAQSDLLNNLDGIIDNAQAEDLLNNSDALIPFAISHSQIYAHYDVNELDDTLRSNPTMDYFIRLLDDYYHDRALLQSQFRFKKSDPEFLAFVRDQALQEGVDENFVMTHNLDELPYEVVNVQINTTPHDLAEQYHTQINGDPIHFIYEEMSDDLFTKGLVVPVLEFHIEDNETTQETQDVDDLEHNPTTQYMVSEIENHYDKDVMQSYIYESRYGLLDKIKESCDELGIGYEHIGELKYQIKDLKITTPLETLAEVYIEEIKELETTVNRYLNQYLYENLITEVDYDIEILDDPEDF